MQWELTGNSLGVHRRNREARYEHAGRSPEEDCKTHHKNVGDYRIGRIGNSLECVGSLPGWHKGVCRKKTETHRKIIKGSRKACRELESGCITNADG
ncbi:hypothetical protein GW17_00043107 [Ensete ventricosum]|nr:hypothetical protein GW17_00043107 [Ensete ventricosum]